MLNISVPISVLRRIEECLFTQVSTAYEMRSRGHRLNRNVVRETEKSLSLISEAILKHETSLIIGESLSDAKLNTEFPAEKPKK